MKQGIAHRSALVLDFSRGLRFVSALGLGSRGMAALAVALIAMLSLTGCSGFFTAITTGTTTPGSTTYAYVTNVGTGGTGGTLTCYTLTSGVFSAVSGSPITLPATPTSVYVAPNDAFLYVATQAGLFLYTIASGGVLTEGNNDTVVYLGPTYPKSITIDSTSSWLIIANNDSTELDALPLDPTTGIPTTVTPVSVTLTSATPAQVAISPANNSVAIALGTGGTNIFGFSASSSTPWGTNAKANGIDLLKSSTTDNAVSFDTTSTYLFIAESTSNSSADTLRKLTLATLNGEVDYPTGKGPSGILADASGAYVYVTNETDNTITGFSISAGVLTALTDSPFATAKAPTAIAEDSTKTYVVTVGYGNNPDMWLYTFDSVTLGTLDVGTTSTTSSADPSLANALALSH